MKNYILSILTALLICSSCEDDSSQLDCFNSDTSIYLSIVSADGEDLLNPKTVGHYPVDSIVNYCLIDGVAKEVYEPLQDSPRNFKLIESSSSLSSIIFWPCRDSNNNGDPQTSYIQWNSQDTDTLSYVFERGDCFLHISKVWLNGELKWDGYGENGTEDRYFKLVKEANAVSSD